MQVLINIQMFYYHLSLILLIFYLFCLHTCTHVALVLCLVVLCLFNLVPFAIVYYLLVGLSFSVWLPVH
jgi:hypothetical protein